MKPDGKVTIVTGGGRGLGRAIALRFANEGSAVDVTGSGRQHLEATAREIVASSRPHKPVGQFSAMRVARATLTPWNPSSRVMSDEKTMGTTKR